VLQGDHIAFKSILFRKNRLGRISYIPDKTALELSKEKKNPDSWLIEFSDKTVTGWLYHPEEMQPTKRLRFLSRKSDSYDGLSSTELENIESQIDENESLWEKALPGFLLLGIFVLLIVLFRSCTS